MTMDELPSINSSTSISDNPELKNYYDKLLFKNSNGKSIIDFQDKFHDNNNNNNNNLKENRVDFINGFNNISPLANNEPFTSLQNKNLGNDTQPTNKVTFTSLQNNSASVQHENNPIVNNNVHTNGRRQSIFNFTETDNNPISMPPTDTSSNIPTFSAFNFNGTPTDNNNSNNSNNNENNDSSNNNTNSKSQTLANLANERRSSYISDSLIHHNYENTNNTTNINTFQTYNNNNNYNSMYDNYNYNRRSSQTVQMKNPATLLNQVFNTTNQTVSNDMQQQSNNNGYPYNRLPSVTTNTYMYQNNQYSNANDPSLQSNGNNQRRNTQPALLPMDINRNIQNLNMSSNKNNQYNYLNFLNTPRYNNNNNSNNGSDNGLILLNNKQLTSSADLQKIYEDCGKNYFSCGKVYSFIDYIIKLLDPVTIEDENDVKFNQTKKSMLNFLAFLKSCNLNYNPQSDAFVSRDSNSSNNNNNNQKNNNRRSSNGPQNNNNSTSSYLHYKPLALVSLKNGKLELLSIPQNSNLAMKRGDLIIIDGDRGKDLALVVESAINLDMALIINFLKKKIHFDSLITNKNQHYPNDKFINTLISSTKGLTDELNPKLYDVIELIQLVVPSKQVLRFATPWEVSTNLHNKFQDELKALHIAQLKLKSLNNHDSTSSSSSSSTSPSNNNLNMNMPQQQQQQKPQTTSSQLNIKILNAEFQYDRKKLTFYYICEERNDFRELIKELFKFYKTRIWLCAIPNNLNIDKLYYDGQQFELAMYQNMMSHYINDDLTDSQFSQNNNSNNSNKNNGGFIVAPPLNQLKLDDFQIGVYTELVKNLFT